MADAARERVLVRKVADLDAAVTEALDFLEQDFRGLRVWVKPNLLGSHHPDEGVTTDPGVIAACVRELRNRSARAVFVGDNPGGGLTAPLSDFVAVTGAVEASDGSFTDVSLRTTTLKLESRFVPRVAVSALLNEVDLILNLPVFKTHALTILTGAVKNLFGVIPGRQKTLLHAKARSAVEFAELMVDIYQALPVPVLSVVDALRGMDGPSGPSNGRVLRIGRLITGRNPVAVDAVMAMMAGTKPDRIPTIRIAANRGLGPDRLDGIEVTGDSTPIPGFRLPTMLVANLGTFLSGAAYTATASRPVLAPDRCTRCGRCATGCPVEAITLAPTPVIAFRNCISCYCCVEFCPERALSVRRGIRGLLRRMSGR
ncbi:MAG TPA: DUF362 domain-containing protein [candidate division WOR-3 bacterium]|uniref:DUF362 domain-containing protein n=1 Tax=candidate division WOR-3 bacterium TaxID=2052148 RepID=A0A7V0T753_UNCW3|nr:DUF362 domain-containing protein [candidate division WOR-3 bacterium]